MALGNRIDPVGRGGDGGGERARLVVEEPLDGPEVVLDLGAPRPGTRVLEQAKRELLDRLAARLRAARGTTAPAIPRAAGAGRRRGSGAPSPADRTGGAGPGGRSGRGAASARRTPRGSRPATGTPRAARTPRTGRGEVVRQKYVSRSPARMPTYGYRNGNAPSTFSRGRRAWMRRSSRSDASRSEAHTSQTRLAAALTSARRFAAARTRRVVRYWARRRRRSRALPT